MASLRNLSVLALLLVSITVGCKGKKPDTGGTGNGTPTPTPGSTATPTPAPSQQYPGAPAACQNLEFRTHGLCTDMRNTDGGVESVEWSFYQALQEAIDNVPRSADLFDETGGVIRGKEAVYAARLGQYLNGKNICAVFGGERTIYMRSSAQDRSEEIEFINNRTRRPTVFGNVLCSPAGAIPGTVRGYSCTTPEIPNRVCGNPQNRFVEVVRSVMLEIINEERPKGAASQIIDFRFAPADTGDINHLLKDDGVRFMWAVADKLNKRGYCVSHDNWKHVWVRNGDYQEEIGIVTSQPIPSRDAARDQACIQHGYTDQTCEFAYIKVWETCRNSNL
jgi:hypothetical protein